MSKEKHFTRLRSINNEWVSKDGEPNKVKCIEKLEELQRKKLPRDNIRIKVFQTTLKNMLKPNKISCQSKKKDWTSKKRVEKQIRTNVVMTNVAGLTNQILKSNKNQTKNCAFYLIGTNDIVTNISKKNYAYLLLLLLPLPLTKIAAVTKYFPS